MKIAGKIKRSLNSIQFPRKEMREIHPAILLPKSPHMLTKCETKKNRRSFISCSGRQKHKLNRKLYTKQIKLQAC